MQMFCHLYRLLETLRKKITTLRGMKSVTAGAGGSTCATTFLGTYPEEGDPRPELFLVNTWESTSRFRNFSVWIWDGVVRNPCPETRGREAGLGAHKPTSGLGAEPVRHDQNPPVAPEMLPQLWWRMTLSGSGDRVSAAPVPL